MLVANVTPGPASTGFSKAGTTLEANATIAAGRLLFRINVSTLEEQLWASDGTSQGTVLLGSFKSGFASPFLQLAPVAVGNSAVFNANTQATGIEPWITDGTPQGTRLLSDLVPGGSSYTALDYTAFAGQPFLIGTTSFAMDPEPLTIDTSTGAVTFSEVGLKAGNASSNPRDLVAEGGIAYFRSPGFEVDRIYRTNGTAAGTTQVASAELSAQTLGILDGRALIALDDGIVGAELWISTPDGQGVELLADLTPGAQSSTLEPSNARLGDALYFIARANSLGKELYRTDGTPAGTSLAVELAPGVGSGLRDVLTFDDRLFLVGRTGFGAPFQLYVSDGSQAGTQLFAPGVLGQGEVLSAVEADGRLYVSVQQSGQASSRVWSVDGSAATPVLEVELPSFTSFAVVDGALLVAVGLSLLAAQPGGSTLTLLDDLNTIDLELAAATETHLYVFVEDPVIQGAEHLWATDGAAAGTVQVAQSALDDTFMLAGAAVAQGARLIFASGTVDTGFEPWISDGTLAGTAPFAELAAGPNGSRPMPLGRVGDRYLLSPFDLATGQELYSFALEDTGAYAAEPFGQGCGSGALPDLTLDGPARPVSAPRSPWKSATFRPLFLCCCTPLQVPRSRTSAPARCT